MVNKLQHALKEAVCAAGSFFAHIISPPACAYCARYLQTRTVLCVDCRALIKPVATINLAVTKTYQVPVVAVSNYEQPLRSFILSKNNMSIVASRQLGQLIWQMTYLAEREIDFFIPIPLHWTRRSWRGFNQAEEIAHALAISSGKPVAQILTRIRRTQLQATLSAQDREQNVAQVFAFVGDAALYKNKHLVVVDDLLTTGSTMKEAIAVLRELKPASITVAVACRVV